MAVFEEIVHLFNLRGSASYGEQVTVAQHSLQAAYFANRDGQDDEMVVAALLHDIGHLLHDEGEDIAEKGVDAHHEDIGDPWLIARFPRSVSEPARLHVAAKRYLCAISPEYMNDLSEASRLSLQLQGGPMSQPEVAEFENNEFHKRAVALRMFDDEGKYPELDVPGLDVYKSRIESVSLTQKELVHEA